MSRHYFPSLSLSLLFPSPFPSGVVGTGIKEKLKGVQPSPPLSPLFSFLLSPFPHLFPPMRQRAGIKIERTAPFSPSFPFPPDPFSPPPPPALSSRGKGQVIGIFSSFPPLLFFSSSCPFPPFRCPPRECKGFAWAPLPPSPFFFFLPFESFGLAPQEKKPPFFFPFLSFQFPLSPVATDKEGTAIILPMPFPFPFLRFFPFSTSCSEWRRLNWASPLFLFLLFSLLSCIEFLLRDMDSEVVGEPCPPSPFFFSSPSSPPPFPSSFPPLVRRKEEEKKTSHAIDLVFLSFPEEFWGGGGHYNE